MNHFTGQSLQLAHNLKIMDKPVQQSCPHLGLRNDPTTSFSYPSKGHACFHAKRKPTPELEYQRSTCLTAQHINCPVYKSPPGVRLPKNIRQPKEPIKIQPKHFLWALLIIVLGLGVYLGINYRTQLFSQIEGIIVPAWRQTQQALPATVPPTATVVVIPTETQQPIATPTSTPEPTASPTITREPAVLALGTPIGGDIKFFLHRVLDGESLGQYTSRHNTTEEAIRAVNFGMSQVLMTDSIVVIPINITDASGLPAFQTIQIVEGGISVEAFAQQLGVDSEEMSLYNNVAPDRILQPGEWVLVPRE